MLVVTTDDFGTVHKITKYHGAITAEVIVGANAFKDIFAKVRDFVGGRSGAYEDAMAHAKNEAVAMLIEKARDSGANAIVGLRLDYEVVGQSGSMMMVCASGTAVSAV